MASRKAQNMRRNVQRAFLCNTPFSYTSFCVSPISFGRRNSQSQSQGRRWEPATAVRCPENLFGLLFALRVTCILQGTLDHQK